MKQRSDFRAYQPLAVKHLIDHPRCALFAGMGTGKTVSTLTALDDLSLVDDVFPALVIAPLRVAQDGWPSEVKKWEHLSHLKVSSVTGTPKQRREAMRKGSDVYVTNWENIEWMFETIGNRMPFPSVVADESTKLRGFRLRQGAVRAQMLARYARRARRWINLSGAPAPNGLIDLWGQTWFLDFGERLGSSYTAYSDRYFQLQRDGHTLAPLPTAQQHIQEALRDLCLTIDGADYFDLREPVHTVLEVDMPAAAMRAYKQMERDFVAQIGDVTVDAANAAVKSMKCLQIASGAIFTDTKEKIWDVVHNAKIELLREVIEEAAGAPVLVAYHWKHDLHRLLKAFPRAVDLSTRAGLAAFKRGEVQIGLGHPQSLGHGTDGMQNACNIIAFFSQWWSLDARDQMIERIGPMRQMQAGHDRPCYVYDLATRGTLDLAVLARHGTKGTVQDALLAYLKAA